MRNIIARRAKRISTSKNNNNNNNINRFFTMNRSFF